MSNIAALRDASAFSGTMSGEEIRFRTAHVYAVHEVLHDGPRSVVTAAYGQLARRMVRPVALKRAQRDLGCDRLRHEARVYARAQHPALGQMLDFGEDEHGRPVLVLERYRGLSLYEFGHALQHTSEQMEEAVAGHIMRCIAGALQHLHALREPITQEFSPVAHGQVSPHNVFLCSSGDVKLLDLGEARILTEAQDESLSLRQDMKDLLHLWGWMSNWFDDPRPRGAGHYLLAQLERDASAVPSPEVFHRVAQLDAHGGREQLAAQLARVCDLTNPASRRVTPSGVVPRRSVMLAEVAQVAEQQEADTVPPPHGLEVWDARDDTGMPSPRDERATRTERATTSAHRLMLPPVPQSSIATCTIPRQPRPAQRVWRSLAIFAAAALVGFVVTSAAVDAWRERPRHAEVSERIVHVEPLTEHVREARARAADPLPPFRGCLATDASEEGHRVFVDGRLAGSGGACIQLVCGSHVVQVGADGPPQEVMVPCGGSVRVVRR